MNSSSDLERYSRHLILKEIGGPGLKKLKNSSVLIIGLGGLGSPLLQYLCASGIGSIGLVDFDKIELSNLNRQIIYGTSDVGKNKTDIARKIAKNLNPSINIDAYNERVTSTNIKKIIKNYDIVADGTDNLEAKLTINDACHYLKKPMVMCSVSRFFGYISTFKSYEKDGEGLKNPSYRSLMRNKIVSENDCETNGILGSIAGIMGSIQATEVIKLITETGENLVGKLLILDGLNLDFQIIKLNRDDNFDLN